MTGEMRSDSPTSKALCQLMPEPAGRPSRTALASPTPRIAPMSVWELEAGRPRYQVPKFQRMAETSSEKTMARPRLVLTETSRSTGSRCTME